VQFDSIFRDLQSVIDHTTYNLYVTVKLFTIFFSYSFMLFFFCAAVDFFNQVNIMFGTLTEFCTPSNCPTMTAGPKYGLILQKTLLILVSQRFCIYIINIISAISCFSFWLVCNLFTSIGVRNL
jgi:hypothetical protein